MGEIRAGVVSLTGLLFMYTFSRCREACLQLHEDAKNLLKHQLNQEHEEIVRALKYVPQENNYLAFTFEGYLTLSSSRTRTLFWVSSLEKKNVQKQNKETNKTYNWTKESDQKNH